MADDAVYRVKIPIVRGGRDLPVGYILALPPEEASALVERGLIETVPPDDGLPAAPAGDSASRPRSAKA